MRRGHVTISRIRVEGGEWVFTCRCGFQTSGHEHRYDASDAMSEHMVSANHCSHPRLMVLMQEEGIEDYCMACSTWFVKEDA
jgi:hypothetical protein